MGMLDTRIALVTGAGRGIGRGICEVLVRHGAAVALADIDMDSARGAAADLVKRGARALAVHCDVTSQPSAEAAVQATVAHFGGLDIVVNNAGVVGQHVGRAVTEEDWDACYRVNLKGSWIVSCAAVPALKARGGGRIVNIASIAGRRGTAGMAHYSASKAGVINLAQSLARDLGPSNITVNAICPGLLWTDMWRALEAMLGRDSSPEAVDRRRVFEAYIEEHCPLRREQTPEDIGEAVAFFASDAARNITGQSLNVDGGMELN